MKLGLGPAAEGAQTLRLQSASSVMRLAWRAKRWQASSVHISSSRTGLLWGKPYHPCRAQSGHVWESVCVCVGMWVYVNVRANKWAGTGDESDRVSFTVSRGRCVCVQTDKTYKQSWPNLCLGRPDVPQAPVPIPLRAEPNTLADSCYWWWSW